MKLNLGCGGDLREGWVNADKVPWQDSVEKFDFDTERLADRFGRSCFNEILCKGCLIEFAKNPIEVFNEFYDVCQDGAIIRVITAVVDTSKGAFRDPTAKRYLLSEWADYIAGKRIAGGRGLGLYGLFEMVSNDVGSEVQEVVFRVVKPVDIEGHLHG